jgi:hypothetical protein
VELDPVYCDRIIARWEAYAKDEAELIACGCESKPATEPSLKTTPGVRELSCDAKAGQLVDKLDVITAAVAAE